MTSRLAPSDLKLALALRGIRVDPSARGPVTSRAAGSVDLALPGGLRVAAAPTDASPWVLLGDRGRLVVREADGDRHSAVRVVAPPRFYARHTSHGLPMWRIATVHGRQLVVTPHAGCGYSVLGTPCPFCIEGARPTDREPVASIPDVVEVVRAAFDEGAAASVCFNSAFVEGEDGGLAFLLPYVEAVRRHFDTLVAAQLHPPRSDRWIDRAYALGIDAVSFNLELFDAGMLTRHCVGRARYIGRERYLDALGYAASIFPRGAVWSDLVMGLEPIAASLAGIDRLTALGVVPVVTAARGAPLVVDPADVVPVLAALYRAGRHHGLPGAWVGDLAVGFAPFEARHFADENPRLVVALHALARSRVGAFAARYLARARRRLRVRSAGDVAAAH